MQQEGAHVVMVNEMMRMNTMCLCRMHIRQRVVDKQRVFSGNTGACESVGVDFSRVRRPALHGSLAAVKRCAYSSRKAMRARHSASVMIPVIAGIRYSGEVRR